jgi:hypothetical protein
MPCIAFDQAAAVDDEAERQIQPAEARERAVRVGEAGRVQQGLAGRRGPGLRPALQIVRNRADCAQRHGLDRPHPV